MNSAETINQGNFKLAIFPTVLLGKNGGDSVWGVAGRVGYGLTPRFDIEAKAATFKGLNYFGVDAEYWLVQGRNVNVSVALGAHLTDSRRGADSSGIDTSLLFSTTPAKQSGALWRPQARLRFGQKLGSQLHPGASRAGTRVPHQRRPRFPGRVRHRPQRQLPQLCQRGIGVIHSLKPFAWYMSSSVFGPTC